MKDLQTAVDFDVVVVGFGPGGEVLSSLLAQAGHRILAIDKASQPYGLPRMSTLDGEIARVLQHTSDPAKAMKDSIPQKNCERFGADGTRLPPIDWSNKISGHWSHYSLHQPNIESAMLERIQAYSNAEIAWGVAAEAVEQFPDYVKLGMVDSSGASRTCTSRFVLGFDGATSFIREALGIQLEVLFRHKDWYILTDFDGLVPLPEERLQTQLHMDPVRPWFWGPNGFNKCRTDVCLLDGEKVEDLMDPEIGYQFVRQHTGLTKHEIKLTRRVAYKFRSQLASCYRKGRIFIGGDAAHAMCPSMGQGACCAMRDAVNLAWKLDLVLKGRAPISLLDTYEIERMRHSRFFVETSLAVWKTVHEVDEESAKTRDETIAENGVTTITIPGLETGIIHRHGDQFLSPQAGKLSPQGLVDVKGSPKLLDDVIGAGGQLISRQSLTNILEPKQTSRLRDLGVHILQIASGDGADFSPRDGAYEEFWVENDVTTLLARPDGYLFGTAKSHSDIRNLVNDFLKHFE